MLIASRSGNISAARLIKETDKAWVLVVEKREVCISKSDSRRRVFNDMSDALKWAGAEPELIEHFVVAQEASAKAAPGNQVRS